MRSPEKIEEEFNELRKTQLPLEQLHGKVMVELLLDIRTLLEDIKLKISKLEK